jgi:signal recognition particle GTPase
MVLNELGSRITQALAAMSNQMVIDEAVLDACLKEIATALLQSDVNVRLVANLRNNVKKRVNVEELAAGLNKRKIIEKAVFDELVRWGRGLQRAGGRAPAHAPPRMACDAAPRCLHPAAPARVRA